MSSQQHSIFKIIILISQRYLRTWILANTLQIMVWVTYPRKIHKTSTLNFKCQVLVLTKISIIYILMLFRNFFNFRPNSSQYRTKISSYQRRDFRIRVPRNSQNLKRRNPRDQISNLTKSTILENKTTIRGTEPQRLLLPPHESVLAAEVALHQTRRN